MKIRDCLPPGWSAVRLEDQDLGLEFLGTENLSLICEQWRIHKIALEKVVELYQTIHPERLQFFNGELERAKKAAPLAEQALANAKWAPLLLNYRKQGYFKVNESIYAYAEDSDYPELIGHRYKRVRVFQAESSYVYATLRLRDGSIFDISATVRSPTFLKSEEIRFLKQDETYRKFWLDNVEGDQDQKDFMSICIRGTRIRNKPR